MRALRVVDRKQRNGGPCCSKGPPPTVKVGGQVRKSGAKMTGPDSINRALTRIVAASSFAAKTGPSCHRRIVFLMFGWLVVTLKGVAACLRIIVAAVLSDRGAISGRRHDAGAVVRDDLRGPSTVRLSGGAAALSSIATPGEVDGVPPFSVPRRGPAGFVPWVTFVQASRAFALDGVTWAAACSDRRMLFGGAGCGGCSVCVNPSWYRPCR